MSNANAIDDAARAGWLVEIARAIDEAQWLAWRIGVVEEKSLEATELFVRLEKARVELEALRLETSGPALPSRSDHLWLDDDSPETRH